MPVVFLHGQEKGGGGGGGAFPKIFTFVQTSFMDDPFIVCILVQPLQPSDRIAVSRIFSLSIDMLVTTAFKDVKLKISCSVNRNTHIGTIDTFSRLFQVKQNVLVVIWKRRLRHIQVTTKFWSWPAPTCLHP